MGLSRGLLAATLLLIELLILQPSEASDGEILEEPTSQYVPIGKIAVFTCRGRGDNGVYWVINDVEVYPEEELDSELIDRGFAFEWEHDGNQHELSMTVFAYPTNNNTEVICKASGVDTTARSSPASLTVMGSPSPPDLQFEALNATTLLLYWETPFSWPDYDVLNYTIRMENASGGEEKEWPMNETSNDTANVFPFSKEGGVSETCAELSFFVAASSILGKSSEARISGGFPIAPGVFKAPVEYEVLFKSNGTPQITFEFKPPDMCAYQTFQYTVAIRKLGTNYTFTSEPMEHVYDKGQLREFVVDSHLEVNTEYYATVTVSTLAGSSYSSTNFSTEFRATTTATPGSPTADQGKPSTGMIIGVTVGSTMAIAFLVLATLLFLLLLHWKLKQGTDTQESTEKAHKAMVANPIYDGPVYESIEQPFSALFSLSIPTSDPRYLESPAPTLKKSEAQTFRGHLPLVSGQGVGQEQPVDMDDNYTVMSPVTVGPTGLKDATCNDV